MLDDRRGGQVRSLCVIGRGDLGNVLLPSDIVEQRAEMEKDAETVYFILPLEIDSLYPKHHCQDREDNCPATHR